MKSLGTLAYVLLLLSFIGIAAANMMNINLRDTYKETARRQAATIQLQSEVLNKQDIVIKGQSSALDRQSLALGRQGDTLNQCMATVRSQGSTIDLQTSVIKKQGKRIDRTLPATSGLCFCSSTTLPETIVQPFDRDHHVPPIILTPGRTQQ